MVVFSRFLSCANNKNTESTTNVFKNESNLFSLNTSFQEITTYEW